MNRLANLSGEWKGWAFVAVLLGAAIGWLALAAPPAPAWAPSDPALRAGISIEPLAIGIPSASPLAERLTIVPIRTAEIDSPLLQVAGSIVATHRAEGWQLASPELLGAWAEWVQASADVAFQRSQLATTRQLHDAKGKAAADVVERLRRLFEIGSSAASELAAEEANLIQVRLEARQANHEAEAASTAATRHHASLERQLEQQGVSPTLLREVGVGNAVVVAEVPESQIARVKTEQEVSVRLASEPAATSRKGRVKKILPFVATEPRTLRLLVTLEDREQRLLPGMFAEVGIGVDRRDAQLVPQTAALHLGRLDYVLVEDGNDRWRVAEVRFGPPHGADIELLDGPAAPLRVVADGAILLKPFVAKALASRSER
ncbi:efflux RND transporter periplasmic adaptor subunit [Vulgatibacter incomptus]|uniref:Cobalt/zinc/cadmium efflux RND transporter, membrane fusion protein, CzcB family n=1 Tax=Vulgatibacter incomptus TaxID=1391653 RepID=A0A0K1PHY5_9BACT|nr:efflux RND transporter periplasmic adaptor subunit [Vulgatibacter incomptus]AKU93140.1 Cobalt/zinc/cadmium efflux RND transporter, membrane fusion protein, CzcB family [Vulgatibacter incomptus]